MQKVMQAYFNTTATTTSPGDVIVMLYDGAISFLERAKQKIIEKDYAQKGILISKAMDVIGELDSSLNIEKGGNLAENLHSLYFFCNTHLLQANLKMDTEKIDKVITILTDLRDAFATIVNTPEAMQAAQTNAMTQRAQAPQLRGTMTSSPVTSNIGNARASSLYAKNSQAFAVAQPAPAMAKTTPMDPVTSLSQSKETVPAQSLENLSSTTNGSGSATISEAETKGTSPITSHLQNERENSLPLKENDTPKEPALDEQASSATHQATPPPRLDSRFQGAALYKKFVQS